jgi:hypothetical protein
MSSATLVNSIAFNQAIVNNSASANAVLSGVTGTCTYTQPETGSAYKKVIIYLSSLAPSVVTGTATITFPVAFTQTPLSLGTLSSLLTTLSTTTAVITVTSLNSGFIVLEGF